MTKEKVYQAAAQVSLFCRLNLRQKIDIPIRRSELGVLLYLYSAEEAITPVLVSDFMGISRPCTTALLKRLERDGYIHRQPSRSDGRSWTLSLTEKGERLIQDAHEEYGKSMQLLEKEMGAERFHTFVKLIEESNGILRTKL